jgi:hypothetical protein
VRIHLAAEHALQLEVAYLAFEALRVALDVARRTLIAFRLGELQQLARVADSLGGAVELADVGAQARALAAELLGARRVRPDAGVLQLAAYLFEALALAVVLKETPVARSRGRRGL